MIAVERQLEDSREPKARLAGRCAVIHSQIGNSRSFSNRENASISAALNLPQFIDIRFSNSELPGIRRAATRFIARSRFPRQLFTTHQLPLTTHLAVAHP